MGLRTLRFECGVLIGNVLFGARLSAAREVRMAPKFAQATHDAALRFWISLAVNREFILRPRCPVSSMSGFARLLDLAYNSVAAESSRLS